MNRAAAIALGGALGWLLSFDAGAAELSLMFSPADVAAIRKALLPLDNPVPDSLRRVDRRDHTTPDAKPQRPVLSNIFVSAVADFGNGDWTVWANELQITPDHQPTSFRVVAVKGDNVTIELTGEFEATLHLRPHQTWQVATNSVVEGIIP